MKSQNERILNYLLNGGSLTPLEALKKFDCLALSSRISNIRDLGYKVKSEPVVLKSGKWVSRYSI
jgi:hypothetical protein